MVRIFKDLLAAGCTVRVFSAGRLVHPVTLEMFRLAGGYDGFWLDQEHAGPTTEQVQMAALAARAAGMGCIVRMPVTHYSLVSQNLESGIDGVMGARIDSAAQAEEFVRWAKFAPRGMRGMNTQGADGHFGLLPAAKMAEAANRDGFVAIQIESRQAVQEADAIAAIDGVDLLFIGPADLAQDLGVLGQNGHELVWEAIDQVAAACRAHGKHWGIVPVDATYAQRCLDKGCRFITCGSDVHAMRRGIAALKEVYAKFFEAAAQSS